VLRPERIRAASLEVLGLVLEEGQLADRALARVLRRERSLLSGERRAVAEAIYGLLRREGALRAGLERALGGAKLDSFPASEVHAALLAGHLQLAGERPDVPVSAKLRKALSGLSGAVTAELAEARSPEERLALLHSLPRWLAAQLVGELGEPETDALFGALNSRAPLTLRTNLLKGTREALLAELAALGLEARPTPLSPLGITLGDGNVFALAPFKQGKLELQDEGSQLLALLCRARPGQVVIDGCAGGGGKTLALAAEMHNRGELWALDSNAKRLVQLKPRARRAGAHNVRSIVIPPEGPFPAAVEKLRGAAHVVLVDAPCSGIGALRRNPDARRRLTEASIQEHAGLQLAILRRLAPLVRPGGLLVYATCSVLRAEDEAVAGAFLGDGGFTPVPPHELLGSTVADAIDARLPAAPQGLRSPADLPSLRLWPQHHGTDGFYAAALRRTAG